MKHWIDIVRKAPRGHSILGLGTLHCLNVAPEGSLLATGGSVGVVVWDYAERRVWARLANDIAPIDVLAFSPDGTRIAAIGRGYVVGIYDVAEKKCIRSWRIKPEEEADEGDLESLRLQFHPNGTDVLVMEQDHAWFLSGKKALWLTDDEAQFAGMNIVGFSAAGEFVVLEKQATSFYQAVPKKKEFKKTREIPFRGAPDEARVSADGRYLFAKDSAAKSDRYAIVDLDSGKILKSIDVTGTLYVAELGGACPLLKISTQKGEQLIAFPERPGAPELILKNKGQLGKAGVFDDWALHPKGSFAIAGDSYGGDLHFRDLDGEILFPPLGRYIYDSDSAVCMLGLDEDGASCVFLGVIGDGQNSQAWAQSWDLKNDRPLAVLTDDAALFCTEIASIPKSNGVIIPTDSGLLLADRMTGNTKSFDGRMGCQSVAVGPNGTIAAGGTCDGELVLWDIATGAILEKIQAHSEQICGIAWQRNGDIIATTSQDETVRFWSARDILAKKYSESSDAKPLRKTKLGQMLYQAAFSVDGSLCAVGAGDGSARIIRVGDGTVIATLQGHGAEVINLVFHPQSGELLTGGLDGAWAIWSVEKGELLAKFESGQTSANSEAVTGISGLGFDARGSTLFVSQSDGVVRTWMLQNSSQTAT